MLILLFLICTITHATNQTIHIETLTKENFISSLDTGPWTKEHSNLLAKAYEIKYGHSGYLESDPNGILFVRDLQNKKHEINLSDFGHAELEKKYQSFRETKCALLETSIQATNINIVNSTTIQSNTTILSESNPSSKTTSEARSTTYEIDSKEISPEPRRDTREFNEQEFEKFIREQKTKEEDLETDEASKDKFAAKFSLPQTINPLDHIDEMLQQEETMLERSNLSLSRSASPSHSGSPSRSGSLFVRHVSLSPENNQVLTPKLLKSSLRRRKSMSPINIRKVTIPNTQKA